MSKPCILYSASKSVSAFQPDQALITTNLELEKWIQFMQYADISLNLLCHPQGNTGENAKAKTKFYHFTWTKPVLSIFIFTRKACMTSYNSELCSHFKSHMHTSALEDAWTNHILSAYLLLNKRIWKFCFFTVGLRCYTYKPKIPNSSHISKCQYIISTL